MEPAETTATSSSEREEFRASSDPALEESAERAETQLLSYEQLYELWERQHWATQDLDFSQDRIDWEGFDEEDRFQRMYGLASFFVGEQKVTDELGPMMRAAPRENQRSSWRPRSPTRPVTCASSTPSSSRSGCSRAPTS